MAHNAVDVLDFLLLTIYPVVALFIIEIISRIAKIPSWPKLITQGITMTGFGVVYIIYLQLIWDTPHWLTSIVLFVLAIALFYQARRAKMYPDKSIY